MRYPMFARSRLKLLPLSERRHDVSITVMRDPNESICISSNPDYDRLAQSILKARKENASVLMMYGAHVIRSGNSPYLIELMKRGFITHFATNGAGAIHDFELAMIGETCESVAKYISEGQFGLWKETGYLNDAVNQGAEEGLGFGEAVGRYIWENNFPYKEKSVLAMGYHLGTPCTVHIGIGCDIVHEPPNFDPALAGQASYTDFLIYVQSVCNLEHGVFLNLGSAVVGPEVYLKALAMARNAAEQEGRTITDFTTAVFDLQPIAGPGREPEKTEAGYYFRPWKTVLSRTVADGGRSYYFCGRHETTIPNLAKRLFQLDGDNIYG